MTDKLVKEILVIDDEKPTLNMFEMLLKAYGYKVLTAEEGTHGIELFSKHNPDLVMTDIKMPGMDGLQVLQEIKSISPDAEVIVITGHGDMDLAIKALNLDATDFLNKPLKREELDKALNLVKQRKEFSSKAREEVQIEQSEIITIKVNGSLTTKSEAILKSVFNKDIASSNAKYLLLFQEKSSINGGAIDVLLDSFKIVAQADAKIAIAGLSANFYSVLKSLGVDTYAQIFDTKQQALNFLQES